MTDGGRRDGAARVDRERADRTRARLRSIGDIPTLPPVLVQVWDLTTKAETSASDLGRVIGSDPGLTGALLRLANSAYFGFPRKVGTVTQAVVILGFETVKSLAMGVAVSKKAASMQASEKSLAVGVSVSKKAASMQASEAAPSKF